MSISSLNILAQHHHALLLAEVAAWLHDMGKCADEHVIKQASDRPANYSYRYKTAQSGKLPAGLAINLFSETVSVKDLIEQGMPILISDTSKPWLLRALGKCHAVAHVEKELELKDKATKQPRNDTRLSTAFGLERAPVSGLTAVLDALPFNKLTGRAAFVSQVEKAFDKALADTRRPVNEVTLADWSGTVAGLYKSALAGALLGIQPDPDVLRWRLLRVNFDVLALYAKAVKIADLLGYQRAVDEACKRVKQLVEEEYPLGNEVYRDTTGIYFTFPDIPLPDDLVQEIRHRVEDAERELAPRIAVTEGEGATAQDELKSILGKARKEAIQTLPHPFDTQNLSSSWQQEWEEVQHKDGKWEVCPVCGLRPKKEHAEVCTHCEKRRASRLDTWRANPAQTIWVGEIADHNDRVALLVGKFGLEDWLSGDLVQTLLVKAEPNNPAGCAPKNPSPARLRRVWETCQRFWDDTVLQDILPKALGNRGLRKHITPDNTNRQAGLYNGKVNGQPLDLFWQPEHQAFLTISNLQAAGKFKKGNSVSLEHPETKQQSEFQIQAIRKAPDAFQRYHPYLPLPASPDQFMVFLPAAEALKIVRKIQKEYAEQFGKVRNRLPLFLGLIYFERKMPLMVVMDAARQMLEQPVPANSEPWTVHHVDGSGHVEFENGISWDVKTVMGDGSTEDIWYPYFKLDGAPAAHHTYQFQHNGKTWVHVKNLRKGDTVHVTPSHFDFLWLDAASRRFEITYDANARRHSRPTRPFYLEDLERLDRVWKAFSKLSPTQQKQVLQTIETARERWFGPNGLEASAKDATFEQFVADTLANAQWPKEQTWKSLGIASPPEAARNDMQTKLITAGVRGELTDLAELHLSILKEKPEEKE